jgi:hypothetical protein
MGKNIKFDAEQYAQELWAEVEKMGYDKLATEEAKSTHMKGFFKRKNFSPYQVKAVIDALKVQFEQEDARFDPMPTVLELYDLWSNRQFHYFYKDGQMSPSTAITTSSTMDLSPYFNEKRTPLWQRDMIVENFHAYMNYKAGENRKKILLPLLVCYGGAILLAFFTPSLLQRLGLIAYDAGWGTKLVNGFVSFILYFLIARKVNSFWLDKVLLGK